MSRHQSLLRVLPLVIALCICAAGPTAAHANHNPGRTHAAKKKHGHAKLSPSKAPVVTGPAGASGPSGKDGAPGKDGTPGRDGTARAYAYVIKDIPSLDASRSKGFTDVKETSKGVYCLTPASGVSPAVNPAFVSLELTGAPGFEYFVFWSSNSSGECPSATQYEVRTYDNSGLPTDKVSFVILVP